ncbi:unnamed protein product [Sphagnum compactum]
MAGRWSAMDPLSVLSDASDLDSEEEEEDADAKQADSPIHEVACSDVRKPGLNYEALSRHGYSGGLSILHVPAPRGQAGEQDWSWSAGKRKNEGGETEETYDDREQTRQLANDSAATRRDAITEQKALSFSQKEKRKRDMGQSSRGKNYVEEEKRLLRDQGVYSGFDT